MKSEFGMKILKASETGEKRSRKHFEGADEDVENEAEPPTQTTDSSAACNRENKVPDVHPAMAQLKKKSEPPQKRTCAFCAICSRSLS